LLQIAHGLLETIDDDHTS